MGINLDEVELGVVVNVEILQQVLRKLSVGSKPKTGDNREKACQVIRP